MQLRILTGEDVRKALPMDKAISAMARAFGQMTAGQAVMPLRSRIATETGVSLVMPAYLSQSKELGVKIVSIYEQNATKGLPVVSAAVMVLDPETGLPVALMDGNSLTAIRTGAGGGLAADLLAKKSVHTVTLFGAGVQARAQLQGLMSVRPVEQVFIISRTKDSARRLAMDIGRWPNAPELILGMDPDDAVAQSDVVITATTATSPLFDGNRLKPGTHVTGVGSFTPDSREVDSHTVHRAKVIVDSREACLQEAGDIIISKAEIYAELGDIVNQVKPGRETDEEITFFKSVGIAAQDAAAAAEVVEAARQQNLGTVVEL